MKHLSVFDWFIKKKTDIVFGVLAFAVCSSSQAQTVQQADSLHKRGIELLSTGKIAAGREDTRQAMEIRKKLLGEVSEDYITSLNNYALSFGMEDNYPKAMELQQQVMQLCEALEKPHKNLGTYAMNMGRYCFIAKDYRQAAKYFEISIPLIEKFGELYERELSWLGFCYGELHDAEGSARVMSLMEEHNQHELTKACNEPKCMLERAQYYGSTGRQAQAKECFLKALAMPMDDETKAQVHEAYATYLGGNVRDYATGSDYFLSAANIRKGLNGKTETYANLMYRAGMYAYIGKKYEQSVSAHQSAVDFYRTLDTDEARKNIALNMKGMGNAYSAMKDHARARDCYREYVSYYERYNPADEEYPKAILRLAKAEKFNKEYTVSIEHHKQAMVLFEERGMASDYTGAAASLQTCYAYAGINETVDRKQEESHEARMVRIDSLIRQELDGLNIARKYLGKLIYARSLATLGGCYEMKEDWVNSVRYYQQYIEAVRDAIRDEFRMQSEAERMIVWGDEKKDISQMLELLIKLPEDRTWEISQTAALAYDAELLSKGILLNSSIEFGKVLAAKGDSKLLETYRQTRNNESEIERLRKSAATDADRDRILKLTQQNTALQLDLYRGCAEYADFTDYISYTWKDIQKELLPTDLAIEFAIVGSRIFQRENRLIAIVLTQETEQPVAVSICDLDKLKEIEADEDVFEKPDAALVIWSALNNYLVGKKRVFFSADGALNRVAIEYLPYNGKPLSEQYEVYRLSSTKELCVRREKLPPSKAALFGDINYNDGATHSEAAQRSVASMRGAAEEAGFADLGNTLREVDGIRDVLTGSSVTDAVRFRDTDASKTAFMSLTDSKVNLLHIATHGMYREVKNSTDAESMRNSLLAFAGANLDDNGIVTAADIAAMNLRQCDMAVLSACETGLGKLGGDGVFGLQRGFKNAGVHTLLMSLKKVNDESTANLMISFYRHLMSGVSKREALVRAQREIREQGFSDPKYWAAFILLDAK